MSLLPASLALSQTQIRLSRIGPAIHRQLVSVRFAAVLIACLAAVSLAGVLLPQIPTFVNDDPAARAQWIARERAHLGPAADILNAAGFFDVFHAIWFRAGLVLLMCSITVCTMSRFPSIWRSIFHPTLTLPPPMLLEGRGAVTYASPIDRAALLQQLGTHRFWVESAPDSSFIYADRNRLAPLATFASHLALILFLAGGFVTWQLSHTARVLVPEGTSAAVFSPSSSRHMQLELQKFERKTDASGADKSYESSLAVYRDGQMLGSGVSSVNGPLHIAGYTFYQSAFIEDGAALRVREGERTVYDEIIPLTERLPAPSLEVSSASGERLFTGIVPASTLIPGRGAAGSIEVAGRQLWVATRDSGAGSASKSGIVGVSIDGKGYSELAAGDSKLLDGLNVRLVAISTVAASVVQDIDGVESGQSLLETWQGADGTAMSLLTLSTGETLSLSANESATIEGRTYDFLGSRAFSGITVRRDPGTAFIWPAAGLLLLGLTITFYLPRRRLWLNIEDHRLVVAGPSDVETMRPELDAIVREAAEEPARLQEVQHG